MTARLGSGVAPSLVTGRPPGRHWWRWILVGVVFLVVIVVAAIGLLITLPSSPSPLKLPGGTAPRPIGDLDGTWGVSRGSVAGFRVKESLLIFSNEVVGRTNAVSGSVTVTDNQVTQATFHVDLTAIKVGGKTEGTFAKSLDTEDHPNARVSLSEAFSLTDAFTSGSGIARSVGGDLTMRGKTLPVTISVSARRDGSLLQAVGSIPIDFSRWGIDSPQGLADRGSAEFLLVLHRT